MTEIASITGPIVDWATSVVNDLGLAGIFVLMLLESACIPIPSEATMLFAGFGVSTGHFSLIGVTIAGVLGNLIGSWLSYAVGYYGRESLIEGRRGGRSRHSRHLESADRFFARHGTSAVLIARVLPIIRTFISLPAGAARMPIGRFTALTVIGCVPWVFVLALIGDLAGNNWRKWHDNLQYLDYAAAAAIVVGVVYFLSRVLRERRERTA